MAKILYVEDNEDNIYMLSNRLQRENFTIVIGRDGSEGVQLANSEQPDLIIMDLILPVMDGYEAASQLRNAEQTRHIPIIALSASVLPEDQHKAIAPGATIDTAVIASLREKVERTTDSGVRGLAGTLSRIEVLAIADLLDFFCFELRQQSWWRKRTSSSTKLGSCGLRSPRRPQR